MSVKAAIDFNREFTLIAAVTNTAADRLDSLKGTVMDLSHETGIAPTELAHSLYFLASAGLSTTQQMQALDATARGAAVGLGTAGDLARITANALNAFQDQGLTATQVMDTLTAAIREGTAEPDEFAQALGRVLPIADNAGISFQQVAASLATMSNAGLDVNEGVTALRAILQSLVAPTAQTTSALATMGLTVTDVVASMQGQGLIATLRMLQDRAKGVTDSTGAYNQLLRHAIPNIRGLAGALNLTGQDAAKVDSIFQAVVNSNGDLAKAFATTAQSDAFKLKQAFNDIQIAGQNLATAVLPELAGGLEFVAKNAKVVLAAFAAWAGMRFIAPMLRDIAAANQALAASEVELAAAPVASAGIGGGAIASRSMFAGAGSAAAVEGETAAAGAGAANATASFSEMGLAVSGAGGALTGMGNAIGASFLPQIFGLIQAVQDADTEFRNFGKGIDATLEGIMNSQTIKTLSSSIGSGIGSVFGGTAGTFLSQVFGGSDQAKADAQKMFDATQTIRSGFLALGYTAEQQAQVTTAALADVGAASLADINPSNIDAYVTAVQGEIDKNTAAAAAAKQQAAAQLELTKQTQATKEASQSWQETTAQMTAHLAGLSRIGIDVTAFMSTLQSDLAGSDDQAKTFADAIGNITKAWTDFKDQAQQALFFIPQALDDLTSSAQQAQDQLDSMTKSSTMTNSEVDALRQTANLTGQDILSSFQDANAQSREFFQNLLDISKVGGAAGKDLASSLLQSGNVVAANIIAHSKLQGQITKTFGTGEAMASKFATQLTDSIVGPLDDIRTILAKIARQQFGIDLGLNDHGAQKKANHLKDTIDNVKGTHELHMTARDDATRVVEKVQHDVSTVVAAPYQITLGLTSTKARAQLANFDSTLNTFLSKKRTVNIGVHTGPKSPWPDEAIQSHLVDPMKATGFKRVGDAWTLPLDVGMHNDPSTFPGGQAPGRDGRQKIPGLDALQHIEQRQLQVLLDIRREIKTSGTGGGAGGASSGTTGGTDGTGGTGHPHGSLRQISPLKSAAADIVKMTSKAGMTLNEGLGIVQRIAAQGLNPAFMRHAVEGVRQELGKDAARQYQQQLRLIDQMTKDSAERRTIARRAAYYAAHPDARRSVIDQQRFMTPLQRSVDNIFQKVFKAGMTPGEAKGIIARVAREGRDPKFIGGAIKDIAKELGPQAAKEFGHSLRSLDASTAHNAKHQQDALDAARDAFKQMTQQAKHTTQQDIKQQQARQEASKQWMADALAYATHNVPKLPRGHTHISVNHHEHRRRQEVRLDRKRFTDAAAYEVDYARGF